MKCALAAATSPVHPQHLIPSPAWTCAAACERVHPGEKVTRFGLRSHSLAFFSGAILARSPWSLPRLRTEGNYPATSPSVAVPLWDDRPRVSSSRVRCCVVPAPLPELGAREGEST